MKSCTLIAASKLLLPDMTCREGWGVAVRDGMIIDCAPLPMLRKSFDGDLLDYPGCTMVPGLVNSHTHLDLTHFPAWKIRYDQEYHPSGFVDWIIQLAKIKRSVGQAAFASSTKEGVRFCTESGTTAVGDISASKETWSITAAANISGRIYLELLGHDAHVFTESLARALETCSSIQDVPGIAAGLSPHSPYTLSDRNMALSAREASNRSIPTQIHVAESIEETDFVFNTTGPIAETLYIYANWNQWLMPPRKATPVSLLDAAGALGPATAAVHCVHVTPADTDLIKKRGTSIVLCPRSNERLDVGKAPVALFIDRQIPLAIGTDSLASNDSLSLWDEMRFALNCYNGLLSPEKLLTMATIGGARVLQAESAIGTIEAGKRADIVLMDVPELKNRSLAENIINSGKVREVFLSGARQKLLN